MTRGRIEAFSDGVFAIIITIMVLELHPPHGATLADLQPLLPAFLCYILSFIYIGIYWNNHHHLMQATDAVNGPVLWANLHLLFWLSLIPFTTAWMGENHFAMLPVFVYMLILLMASISYFILTVSLMRIKDYNKKVGIALGKDWKGKASTAIYFVGAICCLEWPAVGLATVTIVAAIWLIPDKRFERTLTHIKDTNGQETH